MHLRRLYAREGGRVGGLCALSMIFNEGGVASLNQYIKSTVPVFLAKIAFVEPQLNLKISYTVHNMRL